MTNTPTKPDWIAAVRTAATRKPAPRPEAPVADTAETIARTRDYIASARHLLKRDRVVKT